jgi:hypothetical protein
LPGRDGVYQSDPDRAPDSDFLAGDVRHLVAGNRGRLLDARRTPVTVTRVAPESAGFEVEIDAFEDAGARWELPLEDVGDFQFARDGAHAAEGVVAELRRAGARLDRPCHVECDAAARERTMRRVAAERRRLRLELPLDVDVADRVARREGDRRLYGLLDEFLTARGLADMDGRFSERFVSNPRAGELVKGHAIVLAELGLCPYRGKVVRTPDLFAGEWSKARRAEHLVARLAFTQELWGRLGHAMLKLYRAAATEAPPPPERPRSFVSATFSREVADAHFAGGPKTQAAVIWRQAVPLERLLMTFLETAAMNIRFKEAEAIVIADPANRAF